MLLSQLPGAAGGLIDCPALLLPLSVADLLHGPVALPHCLIVCLLSEGDGALLVECLFTLLDIRKRSRRIRKDMRAKWSRRSKASILLSEQEQEKPAEGRSEDGDEKR